MESEFLDFCKSRVVIKGFVTGPVELWKNVTDYPSESGFFRSSVLFGYSLKVEVQTLVKSRDLLGGTRLHFTR